jgi:hypothetical protein
MTITGTFPDSESKAAVNRAVIQAKIDANELIDLGGAKYCIDAPLVLKNGAHIQGINPGVSGILQLNPAMNAIEATDVAYVTLEGFTLAGPGKGSGKGVHAAYVSQVCSYPLFRRLQVAEFGDTGIQLDRAIVAVFDQVVSRGHGGDGFAVLRGTSTTWRSTYALKCAKAGYRVRSLHYSKLDCTAVDSCSIGYEIQDCKSVVMDACGCESIGEIGLHIDNTASLVATCFRSYDNRHGAIWVTGQSRRIKLEVPREDVPSPLAMYSLQVDAGCQVSVEGPEFVTKTILAPNTTTSVS